MGLGGKGRGDNQQGQFRHDNRGGRRYDGGDRDRDHSSWWRKCTPHGKSGCEDRRRRQDSLESVGVLRYAERVMMKRRPDYEEFMDKKASDAKDAEFMCQREMLAAIVVAMFGKNRQIEGTYSGLRGFSRRIGRGILPSSRR